jgi:hypothetical protein
MTLARSLARYPIHPGLGPKAVPQPEFTGLEQYESHGVRNASDGTEVQLVAIHAFSAPWTSREVIRRVTRWWSAPPQDHADPGVRGRQQRQP